MWGDIPTWLAAVGTVAAVSIALWESGAERRRRVGRERRAQAEIISGWFDVPRNELVLLNASDTPVYEVVASMVFVQGAGPRTGEELGAHLSGNQKALAVLPPGKWAVTAPDGWGGMSRLPGVEIAFTDHGGSAHWIRRATGTLEEVPDSAIEHYGIARPPGFDALRPHAGST